MKKVFLSFKMNDSWQTGFGITCVLIILSSSWWKWVIIFKKKQIHVKKKKRLLSARFSYFLHHSFTFFSLMSLEVDPKGIIFSFNRTMHISKMEGQCLLSLIKIEKLVTQWVHVVTKIVVKIKWYDIHSKLN